MKISELVKCQQILRKVFFANHSRKLMAVVSAQKLLDEKESTKENDLVNAPGEKSQSHLTMNPETEILRISY